MTNRQECQLKMYRGTSDYLGTNSVIGRDLPGYGAKVEELRSTILEIEKICEAQMYDRTGITREKQQLRDRLITLTYSISIRLEAFAKINSNTALMEEVKFSNSFLKSSPERGLINHARLVYKKAEENMNSLEGFSITPETQAALKETINGFEKALVTPRLGIAERRFATTRLRNLFEDADKTLAFIDVLMNIVIEEHLDFYYGYRRVRRVTIKATGSVALKAKVVDTPWKVPLKGVKFEFVSDNPLATGKKAKVELVRTTGQNGKFSIKTLAEANYTIRISKSGYKIKAVTVEVRIGETAEMNVELEEMKRGGRQEAAGNRR
jgi:hypothetical protein